jgi:putative heme iron utilization protein
MTKTVAVNYTPEMTQELVEAYKAQPTKATVEAFAVKFGKTARSIVAKLSREGAYVKATPVKNVNVRVTKAEQISALAKKMGVNESELESLSSATYATIALITAAI